MMVKVVHITPTTMAMSSMTITSMMTSTMVSLMMSGMPKYTVSGYENYKLFFFLPTESFIVYMTASISVALR